MNTNGSSPPPTDGLCGRVTGSTCARVPSRSRGLRGLYGHQARVRFWGLSAGGEKGVPSPFLSGPAPYATRPLIVTFVFQAGLRGNPLPGHPGCPRGSLCLHTGPKCLLCCEADVLMVSSVCVRVCVYVFQRALC